MPGVLPARATAESGSGDLRREKGTVVCFEGKGRAEYGTPTGNLISSRFLIVMSIAEMIMGARGIYIGLTEFFSRGIIKGDLTFMPFSVLVNAIIFCEVQYRLSNTLAATVLIFLLSDVSIARNALIFSALVNGIYLLAAQGGQVSFLLRLEFVRR